MTKLFSVPPSPDLTSFAALLGDSFAKRIHLLTQILQGSHYPSVGRYKEKLLARLIAEYIPKNYEVGTGFVLFVHEATKERAQKPGFDPLNMGSHALSKQCDIIVYDSSTVPVVFRDDDFVVVHFQGLPDDLRNRIAALRARREGESITDSEYDELTRLTDQAEELHAERLAAMVELAQLRGIGLPQLMDQLGIHFPENV